MILPPSTIVFSAPANFQRAKIPTFIASDIFVSHTCKVLIHVFPKFSAIATALRMALDLFTVS